MSKEGFIPYYKKMAQDHLSIYFIAAQSFDRAILTLSIASLGFTFAFIEVHKIVFKYKAVLFISWGLFIGTVFLILITYVFLELHALHRFKHYSQKALEQKNVVTLSHWTDCWLKTFQCISMVSFVAGLILFAIFVALNIN